MNMDLLIQSAKEKIIKDAQDWKDSVGTSKVSTEEIVSKTAVLAISFASDLLQSYHAALCEELAKHGLNLDSVE